LAQDCPLFTDNSLLTSYCVVTIPIAVFLRGHILFSKNA